MIRLLLVDDHPVVIDGLRGTLAAHDGMAVVATASTIAEARSVIESQDVDIALVDVRLPDGTGFELLQSARPDTPAVILLTTFQNPQYVSRAIDLGARGFLLKTAPTADIVDAVRRVASGGVVFKLDATGSESQEHPVLTGRELQIVAAVLNGKTNKEIAHELDIASKTVEWHLARVFARMNVSSRAELAVRAERGGWLRPLDDQE